MRGKTNIGGGSENFFIDGNIINGIVSDTGSIVSGDFVEKIMSKKTLQSGTNPGMIGTLDVKMHVSDNFLLENGSFCVFFTTADSSTVSLVSDFKVWIFNIENNEMIDSGVYNIEFPSQMKFGYGNFGVSQIDGNNFLFSGMSSENNSVNYFSLVTVNGNIITTKYLGASVEEVYAEQQIYFKGNKIGNSKLVFIYRDSLKGIKGYIAEINNNSISFGESISLVDNSDIKDSALLYPFKTIVYNDETIAVLFEAQDSNWATFVSLIKINGMNLNLIKTNMIYGYSSNRIKGATYIGNNKILILNDNNLSVGSGNILTLSENVFSLSGSLEIAKSPFSPTNISLYESGEKIFVVSEQYEGTHPKSNTDKGINIDKKKYAIGILDILNIGSLELKEIFSNIHEGSYGTTEYYYQVLCGICENSEKIAFSMLNYFHKPNYYTRSDSFLQYGLKLNGNDINPLEETIKFKKRSSHIDGVAKQSGNPGDIIEVYIPK